MSKKLNFISSVSFISIAAVLIVLLLGVEFWPVSLAVVITIALHPYLRERRENNEEKTKEESNSKAKEE